jgi:hypothetical protein
VAGEEVVGGIVGFLRLDADEFHREITKAIAEVKVLKGMDAKVKVEATGTKRTEAELLGVARAAKGVERNVGGMNRGFNGLRSPQLIVGGIAAGMALLGPVTGAATAAMGGFVGVVGTGILAFQGFKKEIEDGTALGQYLQSQVDGIKGEFAALGHTASSAMSGDVLSALSQVRRFLPSLDGDVESLAGHLGRAFNTSTGGLIKGLQNAMPLLQDGGRYAEILANKFADFTDSQDFKDFIAYAQRELPGVGAAIISLAGGIKDLAVSLAPAGDDLVKIIDATGKLASGFSHVIDAIEWLRNSKLGQIGMAPEQVDKTAQANQRAADAIGEHTTHLLTLQAVSSPLATALGVTNAELVKATDAHRKTADSASAATLQMQLEGNAAGLLKQALDGLNGTNLSAAQAQNAFDSALSNMGDHVTTTGKKVKFTTTSINDMSTASVALRGQLNGQVSAAMQTAEAYGQMKGSSEAGRAKLVELKKQIIDNAVAHGVDRKAVQSYIDKILQVPKKVPPTKLEVETKAALTGIAAFQKAIDSLHGKTVTASVRYSYTGKLPNQGRSTRGGSTFDADGSVKFYASGGMESHVAQIAPRGTTRVWNEPETGGEAYIPLAPSKRARSERILAETNRLMGNPLGGGGGLSQFDIDRLAAAFARVQVQSVVSAGSFDRVMGGQIR